jgi:uncharacterized protein
MQDHKRTTVDLFERLSRSDWEAALALMTDDVTWRIPGKPEQMPSAGVYDKQRLRRLFRRMQERLESGLHMTVLDMVAEGDRVAAEVESRGDLKNGRQYRQQYQFALAFRAGQICTVREYLDTQHAFDTWFRE